MSTQAHVNQFASTTHSLASPLSHSHSTAVACSPSIALPTTSVRLVALGVILHDCAITSTGRLDRVLGYCTTMQFQVIGPEATSAVPYSDVDPDQSLAQLKQQLLDTFVRHCPIGQRLELFVIDGINDDEQRMIVVDNHTTISNSPLHDGCHVRMMWLPIEPAAQQQQHHHQCGNDNDSDNADTSNKPMICAIPSITISCDANTQPLSVAEKPRIARSAMPSSTSPTASNVNDQDNAGISVVVTHCSDDSKAVPFQAQSIESPTATATSIEASAKASASAATADTTTTTTTTDDGDCIALCQQDQLDIPLLSGERVNYMVRHSLTHAQSGRKRSKGD
jgi:hypothetical protein